LMPADLQALFALSEQDAVEQWAETTADARARRGVAA
jgi:hypothetical protein